MKKIIKLVALLLAITMLFTTAACKKSGGKNGDGEQTLDIYCLIHGYGDLWLKSAINRFENDSEIKEKYPNLKVNYYFDSIDGTAGNKLVSGPSVNKYDLLFDPYLKEYEGKNVLLDLNEVLYESEVPGEPGVKVKDKIPTAVLEFVENNQAKPKEDGSKTYNIIQHIQGVYGFYCNMDILKAEGKEVPVTTQEMFETMEYFKTQKGFVMANNKAPLMSLPGGSYIQDGLFDVWWAQYEGMNEYDNFFEGRVEEKDESGSIDVFNQKGRRYALQAIDDMVTGYIFRSGEKSGEAIMQTQASFLNGNGVFHWNGDYMEAEMIDTINVIKEVRGSNYDIQFIKTPIISNIIEKTDTINTDEELRAVIREIDKDTIYDNSTAKTKGVSAKDYETIRQARTIVFYCAPGIQNAGIPEYAAGKEVAIDFLRFMYKDESIKDFTISSHGLTMPTTVDILADEEVANSIYSGQKSKVDLIKGTDYLPISYFNAVSSTPLGKVGLKAINYSGNYIIGFLQEGDAKITVDQILKADRDAVEGQWKTLVALAGLSGN